jgi:FKBP-type peptidyl-prolyl cis-trans isomerase
MRIKILLSFFLIVSFFQGCRQDARRSISEEEYRRTSEALVGANRILVEKDRARIEAFAGRMEWDMKESQTGLWYQVYENGPGDKAAKGMVITLEYELSLIDGTVCYSSDSLGHKKFLIGSGGVGAGLEEGVLLLKEGDRARFVMPPHLAHGLTGDGNKIPQRAIIVYDVKVVKLEPPETAN